MSELKNCPFCGSWDVRISTIPAWGLDSRSIWYVRCDSCHCKGSMAYNEHEAVAAWNTRHQCGLTDEDYNILLDELGVSERTCEYVIEDNMNESEGMGDVWFRCTNCHTTFDYYADDWLMKQNYCPNCGAKVVGE